MKLTDLVGKVHDLLEPLDPAVRQRVIDSVFALLGDPRAPGAGRSPAGDETGSGHDGGGFGTKATRWMKLYGISADTIAEVFHRDGDRVEVIASQIPGRGKKIQTRHCYLIEGVRNLLESDEAKFADADAVVLCKTMGCHDRANHAKSRKELGNIVAGSQSQGFSLPAPGLREAASLIKRMSSNS